MSLRSFRAVPEEEINEVSEVSEVNEISAEPMEAESRKTSPMQIALIVLAGLTLASSGTAYYFYNQAAQIKRNPQQVAQQEVASLIATVAKIIVLPEGETPTVATVVDPEKLKTQPFFEKAQKDDRVIIYTNARKAILYRPAENKIVEVAPLNIGAPAQK